ncbi:MAG: cytochrome oxidase putative small subunit CydP [Sulfurimicrobium sp.]
MKRLWRRPLARELIVVLVVKLALIIGIKLVFFSDPVKPGSEGTAQALLASPAINHTQGVPAHE